MVDQRVDLNGQSGDIKETLDIFSPVFVLDEFVKNGRRIDLFAADPVSGFCQAVQAL
jgi:hypothetical protein